MRPTQFPDLTPEQAAAIVKATPQLTAAIQKASIGVSAWEMSERMASVVAGMKAEQHRRTKRLLELARHLNS